MVKYIHCWFTGTAGENTLFWGIKLFSKCSSHYRKITWALKNSSIYLGLDTVNPCQQIQVTEYSCEYWALLTRFVLPKDLVSLPASNGSNLPFESILLYPCFLGWRFSCVSKAEQTMPGTLQVRHSFTSPERTSPEELQCTLCQGELREALESKGHSHTHGRVFVFCQDSVDWYIYIYWYAVLVLMTQCQNMG